MARARQKLWIIFVPPVMFFIKDIIATIVVLSNEPGISAANVYHYSIALLPATLFVITGFAIPLNFLFGLLVGLIVYLLAVLPKNSSDGTKTGTDTAKETEG